MYHHCALHIKRHLLYLIGRFVILGFTVSAIGCFGDAWILAEGVVMDDNGHPLENARVLLAPTEEIEESATGLRITTNAFGQFAYNAGYTPSPWSPRMTLRVTKNGYKTYQTTITEDKMGLRIILHKDEKL